MSIELNPIAVARALADIDLEGLNDEERQGVYSISIARVIAYRLPLNQSEMDPILVFNGKYYQSVISTLSQINERLLIDIDATLELTRRVYAFRYRIAYDPSHSSVSHLIDALIRRGSPEILPGTSEYLVRHADRIQQTDGVVKQLVISLSSR